METKIKAELKGEDIFINAKYFRGKKIVYEINTAFPMNTSEKEIRDKIKKAGDLFELEEKQRAGQSKIDKKFKEANNLVNNLNK